MAKKLFQLTVDEDHEVSMILDSGLESETLGKIFMSLFDKSSDFKNIVYSAVLSTIAQSDEESEKAVSILTTPIEELVLLASCESDGTGVLN